MTTEASWGARLATALDLSEAEFDRRNLFIAGGALTATADALRRLVRDGRRTRLAVTGRRGAGKSSLLNALAGAPEATVGDVSDATERPTWFRFARAHDTIDWIDMPGFRAGGRATRRREVLDALAASQADGLLWVVQANEVDAGIDDDVADLRDALAAMAPVRGDPVPLAIVVTKVDELAPPDVDRPPFDRDPLKATHIALAVAHITAVARRSLARSLGFVLPVVAYMQFDRDALIDDRRWNIDALRAHLETWLPDGSAVRGSTARKQVARLLDAWMQQLVDVMAVAARQHPAQVVEMQVALERLLRCAAPHETDAPPRWLERVAAADGPLQALHEAARWVRWLGGARALAEGQVRASGRAWRQAVLASIDDAAVRTLIEPRGGATERAGVDEVPSAVLDPRA